MKRPFLLIFLVSVFLINSSSCSKDEPPLVKLDPVFLSYFAFPNGSWWTYKEVNSGKTDSFYVNYHKIENHINKKEENARYETLAYHLFSKHDTSYGFARPFYNSSTPKDSIKFRYVASPPGKDEATFFIYKIAPGQNLAGAGYVYVKHLDTILIQGKIYNDIYYTKHPGPPYFSPIISEYYCRNFGVIKREYFDGTIWELTNYHINK